MKITRSREHTVNLGNYENVKIGASVELSEDDFGKDADPDRMVAEANTLLDQLLERDLAEALANVPSSQNSHLETWSPGE